MVRCQGLTCEKNHGRRYLDLVPVIVTWKMDVDTQETSAQIAGPNFTVDLVLSDPSERSKRNDAKEEGSRVTFFGDCWIEQVIHRKYIEATRV